MVPCRGARTSEDELLAFLRSRLAAHQVPRSLRFVAELPVSPQGKVLRRLLRDAEETPAPPR